LNRFGIRFGINAQNVVMILELAGERGGHNYMLRYRR
jgi:hypothetical protein